MPSIFTAILFLASCALSGYVIHNTLNVQSNQFVAPYPSDLDAKFSSFDFHAALQRLAQAVRLKTVSYEPGVVSNPAGLRQLHDLIKNSFPRIHQYLSREVIGNFSLLYTWPGSEPSLKPVLLMAHMDVVPAENDDVARGWDYEPFAGLIIDDYLYGRGTIDDKISVLSIMEAVEHLLIDYSSASTSTPSFVPRRTIYLAFGHDEEVSGADGAELIVKHLQTVLGVKELEFALDEGGIIATGVVPGVQQPIALVAVGEKGSASFQISVSGTGGHSSMPPPPPQLSPIAVLAKAVLALETHPFPIRDRYARMLLDYVCHELPFPLKPVVANWDLTSAIVHSKFTQSAAGNANLRTVMVPTMLSGSPKANVLPLKATAIVNVRLLPGDTTQTALAYMRQVVNDDRVNISALSDNNDPPPVSDPSTPAFRLIQTTIHQLFPDVLVAPMVTTATTDVRHFTPLTANLLRFQPIRLTNRDLSRIHGLNERIHVSDSMNSIKFFYQLLRNVNEFTEMPSSA